jgi:hypothetical protein
VSVEAGGEDSVTLLRRQRYRIYTDEGVN